MNKSNEIVFAVAGFFILDLSIIAIMFKLNVRSEILFCFSLCSFIFISILIAIIIALKQVEYWSKD